jgi:hypothetical protein
LETGERGREDSWERGSWRWMWTGCDTVVLVVFVVAVEVGLLVDVNSTHFHWLTREKTLSVMSELILEGKHTVVEVSPRPLAEVDGRSSHNDG